MTEFLYWKSWYVLGDGKYDLPDPRSFNHGDIIQISTLLRGGDDVTTQIVECNTEGKMFSWLNSNGFLVNWVGSDSHDDLYRLLSGFKVCGFQNPPCNPECLLVAIRVQIDGHGCSERDDLITVLFHLYSGTMFPTVQNGFFTLGWQLRQKCECILIVSNKKAKTDWKYNVNKFIAKIFVWNNTTFPYLKCSITVLCLFFIEWEPGFVEI